MRLRAWDGSEAGPAGGPTLVLRSRQALRRLLWHPGELGLAQAYVTGELDVDGDLTEGLRSVWRAIRERGLSGARLSPAGLGGGRPGGGGRAADPRARRPPAWLIAVAGADQGPPAQPQPGPGRHLPPLRRARRVLPADPGSGDGLLVRAVAERRSGVHAGRRPARQAGRHLPQARPRPGVQAARRGLRLGVTVRACGAQLRRRRHRRHARARAGAVRPGRLTAAAGQRRHRAEPGLPGHRRGPVTTRSPRSRWASTWATGSTRRSAPSCANCSGPAAGC